MTIESACEDPLGAQPSQWRRPTLNAYDVADITLLGKLGSLFDADTGDNTFSAD